MAINGIHSYGMGYYNYQSSINNIRLTQALARNPKFAQSAVSKVSPVGGSLKDSVHFMKKYNSAMSELMSASNSLRDVNRNGAMKDLEVTSSNENVASAKERFQMRDVKEMTLNVSRLAKAQVNKSAGVKGSERAADDMNFTVGNGTKSVSVNVSALKEDGTSKTNLQMLREAASQINKSSVNVRASVVEKDGMASLELTGTRTGTANRFQVNGELGAAKGADKTETEAENAVYSVTMNGRTSEFESHSNEVTIDSTRVGVTLKGVGETTIRSDVDADKVVSAVDDLVKAYNASLKLLNDNYDRGTGVDKQLRNLVAGLGSEQSLEKLGITVNKDATLKFDGEVLKKSLREEPSLTKELISGTSGIANKAFNKATAGMNVSSGTLINRDIESAQSEMMGSPLYAFNLYSKGGAYAMNNYYAAGMMMNYLV